MKVKGGKGGQGFKGRVVKARRNVKALKASASSKKKVMLYQRALNAKKKLNKEQVQEALIASVQDQAERAKWLKEEIFIEIDSRGMDKLKIKVTRGQLINKEPISINHVFGELRGGKIRQQLDHIEVKGSDWPTVDWKTIKRIE